VDDLYWDPWDPEINAHPYDLFRQLRDEAPLYYNERHDFYALSRADDVEAAFVDHRRLISGRSSILEFIQSGMDFPSGMFIFEDPPQHTKHRGLLSRVFTPRRMLDLEPSVRDLCVRILDPLVGSGGFDFAKDFAAIVSSRVIGMLLGIPESDQPAVREHTESHQHPGRRDVDPANFGGEYYANYIEWREANPSDDLMTQLLNVEFEDEHGVTRKLTRQEVLTYVNLLSGAGNDTTAKLIGWSGKLLADHPGERRFLVEDPSLIPDAVEELLRYEPPGMQNARFAIEDVRPRALRRPPAPHRHHDLRVRCPLLSRRRARPTAGAGRARGAAEAVPRVDRRRGPRGAAGHLHHARLGDLADPGVGASRACRIRLRGRRSPRR
jgi:cytochrome P450